MKWLIQSNIPNKSFDTLLSYLDNSNKEVETFRFTEADYKASHVPLILDPNETYGFFGSVQFNKTAMTSLPFDFCLSSFKLLDQYEFLSKVFGTEYLNVDAIKTTGVYTEKLLKHYGKIFVKPEGDKTFPGIVLDSRNISDIDDSLIGNIMANNEAILVNPKISNITREMRFWVVDNEIVSCSTYAIDNCGHLSKHVPPDALSYAESVKEKCRLVAYTLDIAQIQEGDLKYYKVIEINCANTSGLYVDDEDKIIQSLEKLYTDDRYLFSNSSKDIIIFDDSPIYSGVDSDYDTWLHETPFNEEFLDWFMALNYEPTVQLYVDTTGWIRVPLFSVKNWDLADSDPSCDSIIIKDPEIRMLYKLTWM